MLKKWYENPQQIRTELLCGLTVALALIPEAIAFAMVAGIDPMIGLYSAFAIGLITSITGGRPGMISGATGAIAVVIFELVGSHGVEYLFVTVILMGIIQMIIGFLRLGKFIRFMPHTVMVGFVNGLAIVIGLAQLNQFKTFDADGIKIWMQGSELYVMIGLVLLTMAIIHFFGKWTKVIPAPLVAIVAIYLLVTVTGVQTKMVGDIAKIGGGLPSFILPDVPYTWKTLTVIFPYALTMAAVGLIESLMTLTRIDEITGTRGRANKECVGQGLANIITGFIGGMGGCAMIGQSMINITSGARKRLSGISAAVFLILFILFGSTLIERIPIAALTGVMFMVVIETFEWSSFKIMKSIPVGDAVVIAVVSVVTVFTDLAVAVGMGVILSALVFAWKKGKEIDIVAYRSELGIYEYRIQGTLFFASAKDFVEKADFLKSLPKATEHVIFDFQWAKVMDHSGIEAINRITHIYRENGITLHLRHLSDECYQLLKNAEAIIEVNPMEDPNYHVADDALA